MSRATYTIHAIECDVAECFETFEGAAGEPKGSVAMQARDKGWAATGTADYCPAHAPGRQP